MLVLDYDVALELLHSPHVFGRDARYGVGRSADGLVWRAGPFFRSLTETPVRFVPGVVPPSEPSVDSSG